MGAAGRASEHRGVGWARLGHDIEGHQGLGRAHQGRAGEGAGTHDACGCLGRVDRACDRSGRHAGAASVGGEGGTHWRLG